MAPVAPETLSLAIFVLLVVAAALLLYVQRPTVTRPVVYASLPWLVAGAVLQSLARPVDYPAAVEPLLRFPLSYLLMAALCVVAWTMLVQSRTSERARSLVPTYLGVMGLGALLGPFAVLVLVGGASLPFEQLLSWLVAPVVALVTTYVALVALGLWLPRTAAFVGSAGGVVLFGATLDAVVAALVVSLVGDGGFGALDAVAAPVAAAVGVSPLAVLVWTVVWTHLAVAVVVVSALALLHRSRPALAERGLHLSVVASVLVGANGLVVALSGGVVA